MNEIRITIPDIPPSVNHYWGSRGNRRFLLKRVEDWKKLVYLIANKKENKRFFKKKLQVKVFFILPDKRKRDIDNLQKAVLDSLKGICFEDDNQVMESALGKCCEPKMRETHIIIKPFEGRYDFFEYRNKGLENNKKS